MKKIFLFFLMLSLALELKASDKKKLHKSLILQGKVVFNQNKTVYMSPRYSGLVSETFAREGERVKVGKRLATIERNIGLGSYFMTSPVDGIIVYKDIVPGEFVSNAHKVFVISNLRHLWVQFDVSQDDIQKLEDKSTIKIKSRTSSRLVSSSIFYISPIVEQNTRTITVFSELKNHQGSWHPFQLVDGVFKLDSKINNHEDQQD